jgi:hypothetical protein|tara:strand:+ start:4264 stop:4422 length:159 start_codon:yes stop_codon:yes gene_type:complete
MFIRKTKQTGVFSLREKFLENLEKDLRNEQIELNEAVLRKELKKKVEKGNLF